VGQPGKVYQGDCITLGNLGQWDFCKLAGKPKGKPGKQGRSFGGHRMARSTGVLLWAQISAVMQLNQIIGDLFWTGYFITLVWDLDGPVLMRPAFLVLGGFFSLVTLVGMILAAFGARQSLPGLRA
jgi:hypothetical protein